METQTATITGIEANTGRNSEIRKNLKTETVAEYKEYSAPNQTLHILRGGQIITDNTEKDEINIKANIQDITITQTGKQKITLFSSNHTKTNVWAPKPVGNTNTQFVEKLAELSWNRIKNFK